METIKPQDYIINWKECRDYCQVVIDRLMEEIRNYSGLKVIIDMTGARDADIVPLPKFIMNVRHCVRVAETNIGPKTAFVRNPPQYFVEGVEQLHFEKLIPIEPREAEERQEDDTQTGETEA